MRRLFHQMIALLLIPAMLLATVNRDPLYVNRATQNAFTDHGSWITDHLPFCSQACLFGRQALADPALFVRTMASHPAARCTVILLIIAADRWLAAHTGHPSVSHGVTGLAMTVTASAKTVPTDERLTLYRSAMKAAKVPEALRLNVIRLLQHPVLKTLPWELIVANKGYSVYLILPRRLTGGARRGIGLEKENNGSYSVFFISNYMVRTKTVVVQSSGGYYNTHFWALLPGPRPKRESLQVARLVDNFLSSGSHAHWVFSQYAWDIVSASPVAEVLRKLIPLLSTPATRLISLLGWQGPPHMGDSDFLGKLYGQFGGVIERDVVIPGSRDKIRMRVTRLYDDPKILKQIAATIGRNHEGQSVLAIGVGTGTLEEELAKWWKLSVYAVDASLPMTLEATKKWVDPAVADAHRLPFPDNHFDIVTMIESFGHLRDPDTALAEAKRVLKPGGTIHIVADRADFPEIGYRGYRVDQLIALLSKGGFELPSEVVGLDTSDYAYVLARKPAKGPAPVTPAGPKAKASVRALIPFAVSITALWAALHLVGSPHAAWAVILPGMMASWYGARRAPEGPSASAPSEGPSVSSPSGGSIRRIPSKHVAGLEQRVLLSISRLKENASHMTILKMLTQRAHVSFASVHITLARLLDKGHIASTVGPHCIFTVEKVGQDALERTLAMVAQMAEDSVAVARLIAGEFRTAKRKVRDVSYCGSMQTLILLAILRLGGTARGDDIREEIRARTQINVSANSLNMAINPLLKKTYISLDYRTALDGNGNREYRHFTIERLGITMLRRILLLVKEMSQELTEAYPLRPSHADQWAA